jgi:hypothetical protein
MKVKEIKRERYFNELKEKIYLGYTCDLGIAVAL